jgi:hypothetical protein
VLTASVIRVLIVLLMQAVNISEAMVWVNQTARLIIPEDSHLYTDYADF